MKKYIFGIVFVVLGIQLFIPAMHIKNPVASEVFPVFASGSTSQGHTELANIVNNIDTHNYSCMKNIKCEVNEAKLSDNINAIQSSLSGDFSMLELGNNTYKADDILGFLIAANTYYSLQSQYNQAQKVENLIVEFSKIVLDEENVFDAFFQLNVVTYLKSLDGNNNYSSLYNREQKENLYKRNIFLQYQYMINISSSEGVFGKYDVEDVIGYTRNYYYTVGILEEEFNVTFFPKIWNYQSTRMLKNHYKQKNNFIDLKNHLLDI